MTYSTMTCFETTNIGDRALIANNIDALFVPVYNRDTLYFSNIINSFVRDARCYVIQSNANCYGDSRISGPLEHSYLMDIVKLKGGVNNYLVVGQIDVNALHSSITKEKIKPKSANNSDQKYMEDIMEKI